MTKKEKCFAVFIGCATFAIFALILEGTCNALILGGGRAAYLIAILIHAFVDAMAGALSLMKINAVIIELVVCILVIPLVCFAIVLWKRNSSTKIESEV